MKRLILTVALFAAFSFTNSYAATPNIPNIIMETFHQSFGNARDISTTETASFYRIEFTLDGVSRFVYYDHEGNLMVTAIDTKINELPQALQTDLKTRFPDIAPTECYKLSSDSKTEYCVIAKKGNRQITLLAKGRKWKMGRME
ncbi:MAG TPA: hypothetical protein VNS32_21745 [Flavisolibacter sp.]|nr:hypothetical protein [Flavisolibacter sp.]